MTIVWTYDNWDAERLVVLGADEYYRRTLVIRMPFTTRAVVVAISRVGSLYDPVEYPDANFDRWRRAYHLRCAR